jgi:hypothetical protein
LDGQGLFDVDLDAGGEVKTLQSLVNHLPGGVALGVVGFGARNTSVIRRDLDAGV